MILPSIKDAGTDSVVMSPFTTLLSGAINKAKSDANLVKDLTIAEGCSSTGDQIAAAVSEEILQTTNAIESSTGISFSDILSDFIDNSPNEYITESAAQNLAKFFPYFKSAADQFDEVLSNQYGITINTNLTIDQSTVSALLEDSNPEKIQLDYLTIFRDEPNSLGWYIEDKVEARGGNLNSDGTLVHGACYSGDVNQCQSTEFNLESIKDASTFFERRSNLYNSQYNPSGINWFIEYQDSQYANYNVDGSLGERRCSTKHKLLITPQVADDSLKNLQDNYETGVIFGGDIVDSCSKAKESGVFDRNPNGTPDTRNNLLCLCQKAITTKLLTLKRHLVLLY